LQRWGRCANWFGIFKMWLMYHYMTSLLFEIILPTNKLGKILKNITCLYVDVFIKKKHLVFWERKFRSHFNLTQKYVFQYRYRESFHMLYLHCFSIQIGITFCILSNLGDLAIAQEHVKRNI
jgi:hypothetical protein